MVKPIIIIEGEEQVQCDTFEDIVKILINKEYFEKSKEEQKELIKTKACANCLGTNYKVIETPTQLDSAVISNSIFTFDEMSYILSLICTQKIVVLENVSSNIFISNIDKSQFTKNYVLVNNFSNKLIRDYLIKFENRK